ncbi:hypothetical protein Tco_0255113 [Tanacetum coccineum]
MVVVGIRSPSPMHQEMSNLVFHIRYFGERWLFLEKVEGRTSEWSRYYTDYKLTKKQLKQYGVQIDSLIKNSPQSEADVYYLTYSMRRQRLHADVYTTLAGVVGPLRYEANEAKLLRFGNDESHEHHMFTRLS